MRLVTMGGYDDELGDAVVLPMGEKLVDGSMKGLTPKSGSSRPGTPADGNTVREDRGPQDAASLRNLGRDGLGHAHVRAERKVGTVLFQGSDGYDQTGIPRQGASHSDPAQLVKRV